MKIQLNKQRKVYLGVLGAAVAALLADQLTGGGRMPGPEAASASLLVSDQERALAPVAEPAPGAPSPSADSLETQSPVVSVASQLLELENRFPSGATVDDGFALPGGLLAIVAPASSAEVAAPIVEKEGELPAIVPAPSHLSLTTIVTPRDAAEGSGAIAVVNGETLKVGSTVGGWRIERIGDRSVVIRNAQNQRSELVLRAPMASGASAR